MSVGEEGAIFVWDNPVAGVENAQVNELTLSKEIASKNQYSSPVTSPVKKTTQSASKNSASSKGSLSASGKKGKAN